MRKTLFAFVVLFQAFAWADESKTLNCKVTQFKAVDVFLEAEMQLQHNPVLILKEKSNRWFLQIGQLSWDNRERENQLRKQRRVLGSTGYQYTFRKNGILEYQLDYDLTKNTAQLYWWGTGRKSFMASFSCDLKAQFSHFFEFY